MFSGFFTIGLALNSNSIDDAAPLSFGVAKRIRLNVADEDVGAIKGPVVVGYSIEGPRAAIVDDQDRRLFTGNDPPAIAYEGEAWALSEKMIGRIVATKPGHTVLRWRYAGLPDRTLDLEAVDAAEARALYIYAAPPPPPNAPDAGAPRPALPKGVDPDDIKDDPYLAGGRTTSLAFASPGDDADFPTRVALADGRLAVAVLDTADVAPYDLIYARAAYGAPSFLSVRAGRAGKGTLTVGAGHATLTLPVTVAPPPPKVK